MTTSPSMSLPPRSSELIIFESIASVSLIVLSVTGNVFILTALYRNPRLRNTTNIYIAALAITDLLNASIPGTLFASAIIAGKLVYSTLGCRLSGFLVHFLTYVSMATMTLTAVNRYFRVVKPQYYKKLFGDKRSCYIIAFLWLLIAAFVLYPTAFGMAEFSFNSPSSFCAYTFANKAAEVSFTLTVVSVLVVFCLSLVCVCYYQVSKATRSHNAGVFLSLQGVSAHEIKLSKVLFIMVFAFALCWLPTFGVILLIRLILGRAPHGLAVMIPFLLQTSSVLNPIIYGALSPPFRREFRRLISLKRADCRTDESHRSVNTGYAATHERGLALEQISIRHNSVPDIFCSKRNGLNNLSQREEQKIAWL